MKRKTRTDVYLFSGNASANVAIEKLEEMEAENAIKIEKLEAKLRTIKDEQAQIIETLAQLKRRKEETML